MSQQRAPVADPGFSVGGRGLPRWLHFVKFVCQNERIGSFRGARAGCAHWIRQWAHFCSKLVINAKLLIIFQKMKEGVPKFNGVEWLPGTKCASKYENSVCRRCLCQWRPAHIRQYSVSYVVIWLFPLLKPGGAASGCPPKHPDSFVFTY